MAALADEPQSRANSCSSRRRHRSRWTSGVAYTQAVTDSVSGLCERRIGGACPRGWICTVEANSSTGARRRCGNRCDNGSGRGRGTKADGGGWDFTTSTCCGHRPGNRPWTVRAGPRCWNASREMGDSARSNNAYCRAPLTPQGTGHRHSGAGIAASMRDDELPEAYATATIYLDASRSMFGTRQEGNAISLIEAASAGLPLLASDFRGPDSIVRDGETGISIDPIDPAGIASAIASLLNDSELRREMGMRGRERVESHFNWDRVAHDVARFVRECVANG